MIVKPFLQSLIKEKIVLPLGRTMQKYGIMTLSILIQVVDKNELFEAGWMSNRQELCIV